MNKLALLSSIKIPEFVRDEYPELVAFVTAYYRYMESQASVKDAKDLDDTNALYLNLYRDTIAKGFAKTPYLNVRQFIFANKDFFSRKGTPEAFDFFFKAYFGEKIEIRTPNFLVASGGEASGNFFFYLTIVQGVIEQYDELEILRPYSSNLTVDVIRVVRLDATTYAVYFNPPVGFVSRIRDRVTVKNSLGVVTFVGRIKPTPVKFGVGTPGKFWQIGQIIKVPPAKPWGTPTIARVRRINSDSGLSAIEIIQWGYPLLSEQYTMSSFNPTADNSTDSQSFEQTLDENTGNFQQDFSLYDNAGTVIDFYTATITNSSADSYYGDAFPDDYCAGDYGGSLQSYNPTILHNPATNIVEYEKSFATIKIGYSNLSKDRNVYLNENSILSNQNTKLHDNLNYQAFAYNIQTTKDIAEYRGSIDLIHPAGIRFSSTISKTFNSVTPLLSVTSYNGFPRINVTPSIVGNVGNMTVITSIGIIGNIATGNLG